VTIPPKRTKTAQAANTPSTPEKIGNSNTDTRKEDWLSPRVPVDDLPQISAASKKVKLDTMADRLVICYINLIPITVSDYKHEFKMREAQTQALLTARPDVENQLLEDAKTKNITLTPDEKHRLIAASHKATSKGGNVLKNYMKESSMTLEAFDEKILDVGLALKDGAFQTRQSLLNQLVDQQLLVAKAKASGYTNRAFNKYMEIKRTQQYKNYLAESGFTPEEAQTQLVNRQLIVMAIEGLQKAAPAPSQEQIKKVYDSNLKQLQHGDRVRLSLINIAWPEKDLPGQPTVRTQLKQQFPNLSDKQLDEKVKLEEAGKKKRAESLLAEALKPGTDFAKLANTSTDDQTTKRKKNGGDLGFKDLSYLDKKFRDQVKNLKPGEVYPQLLKNQFGWNIVKCVAKEGKGTIPISEIEPEISAGLQQQNQAKAVLDFIASQHKSADIKLSSEFQTLIAQDTQSDGKKIK
jgi:parvulin-like peptidyl-prolyl isomerase